ncbi:hypothetical protein [Hydrogenovibrio halophilus]|nr:hypothetical protein [Hydrogenovibrio halophilus]
MTSSKKLSEKALLSLCLSFILRVLNKNGTIKSLRWFKPFSEGFQEHA